MRLIKKSVFGVAVACVLVAVVGVPVACAEGLVPWWGLTSGARPTNIQSGVAKDEVQRLTITATGGNLALIEPVRLKEFENSNRTFEELLYVIVPYNATAGQIQEGLESKVFPSSKVAVKEEPAAPGTKAFAITFPGQSVEPLVANGEFPVVVGEQTLVGKASITEFAKGASGGQIVVTAENLGDGNANGKPIPVSIVDKLPAGLQAVGIEGFVDSTRHSTNPVVVGCSLKAMACTFAGSLVPYEVIEVRVSVVAQPGAVSGEVNEASVSGGGATPRTVRRPIHIGVGETPFGVEEYGLVAEEPGGVTDTQAGSHPFQLTSTTVLNQTGEAMPAALTKDLNFELPEGLIGNPTPFPRCTDLQFSKKIEFINECAPNTAVGMATITFNEPKFFGLVTERFPVFNLVPRAGEPARFGFLVLTAPVFLDTSVRTGGDYGVTVSVNNITQIAGFLASKVTFWGVPGDPRHDTQRGWGCVSVIAQKEGFPCKPLEELNPPPFLSLPTSCTGALHTTVEGDSWKQPGVFTTPFEPNEPMSGLDGCNRLPFDPGVRVKPDVVDGSTPTGLTVGVHVSQSSALNPTGIAESTLRDTTVTLPTGVTLNPGGADGLQACSEEQMGFLPADSHGDELHFTPDIPSCPDGSKIATVKITTPLLPNALEGQVYLAEQNHNPFGSLIAMYIVAKDPVSGVLVKLPGKVLPDPLTGQLVSTFQDTPQLPFEELEIHFFGGDRAPLSTPSLCGSYTTVASFSPWSGESPVAPVSTFDITSGPSGSACSSPLPFSPSLTAGSTNIQTGAFSQFTMTMSREDGNQNLQAIQLHMPPGLLGTLASVELCPEPQASQGTCGPNSLIGETTVSVGLGGNPYAVKGGRVYITGPYQGAPYGLSIVNPAKAGPFDLGEGACDCVLVRAKIEVDPLTAALTITSDNSGPYKIPQILDGIPLQIKHVNVSINRPNFTFNPTNCSPQAITGSLSSTQGGSSALQVPFQVTNCATLAFKPQFKVSTAGRTSRAKGASLDVKLSYPKAPWGSQANIKSVKVDLPKQLPSRLTTLQKACTASVFNENPAACPAASRIGTASATTPIIPVGLSGPAYFVSHGGAKFPELVIVLSGYGVTVQLHGETFISKAGITSSTFRTIPDVPIGSFELKLPQGPLSALAANGNLCTSTLKMPTTFTAQNGIVIHQSTPITATGCAKHGKPKKQARHRTRKGK